MSRPIRFNAFDMNCVVHQSPGLWRHPEDQSSKYKDLEYWTYLAQLLEKGFFDGLFIADVLGVYDIYGGSPAAALLHGAQIPVNDPILLVSAMAAVTEHLGFGITAGTAFEHPFPFARRISTLDHLTKGRIGWNVVTGYLPSAAENLGQQDQFDHDTRYDHADEYIEVLYKLWEGSWEDDAVVKNTKSEVYTNPSKVHPINHKGKYFTVPGIHVSEPSPQRTPVIYQAGTSSRGVKFAGKHAEAVFIAAPAVETTAKNVASIRAAVQAEGRPADSVLIYALATIITGEIEEAAQEKYQEYLQYASSEGGLVLLSGWTGFDLSAYQPEETITNVHSNAIQSAAVEVTGNNPQGKAWTVKDLGDSVKIGGRGPIFVGSPTSVVDQLQAFQAATDVDGFNLAYAITPGTFEDIIEYIVPELQKRGIYPTTYTPGTLREKLFQRGNHLPPEHAGTQYSYKKHNHKQEAPTQTKTPVGTV